jgi:outer membrane lipoprotein-sorting protein
MKIVLLPTLLAAAVVGFYGQTTNTSLDRSGKTLREANSLTASFIQISGVSSPLNGTLAFAKPDRFRIETPEHLTISDG